MAYHCKRSRKTKPMVPLKLFSDALNLTGGLKRVLISAFKSGCQHLCLWDIEKEISDFDSRCVKSFKTM